MNVNFEKDKYEQSGIQLNPCPRCNSLNPRSEQYCAKCGTYMFAEPSSDSLFKIWMDMLFDFLGSGRDSSRMYFSCLKLEPDPGIRTLIGFLLAVAIPFILPTLFSLLNRFAGIGLIFGVFLFSLISTLISFYFVSILTYLFAKLLGGRESFSIHSFLLSLIYAPFTSISLLITIPIIMFFEETPSTCLNVLNVVILVFTLIYTVQLLRFGHELSLGRSVVVTSLTMVTSIVIAVGIGIGLLVGNVVISANATATRVAEATAEVQATATREAEATATIEARTIGGRLLEIPYAIRNVSFSPDGNKIITTGRQLKLWDATPLKNVTTLSENSYDYVVYSPDGLKLVAADYSYIELWDTQTWQKTFTLERSKSTASRFWKVEFSLDGQKLLVPGSYGGFSVLDVNTNQQIHRKDYNERRGVPTFSPDGRFIAAPVRGGVLVSDADTGESVIRFAGGGNNLERIIISYSSDGHNLAVARIDGMVEIWDTTTWEKKLTFDTGDTLEYAEYIPGDHNIVTASREGLVAEVWNVLTGEKVATLYHQGRIKSVNYSQDGEEIIILTEVGVVIWEVVQLQSGGEFRYVVSP